MNEHEEKEYIFIASGVHHRINEWGMLLASSDKSAETISFMLNDNVYPPFMSHKFIRDDIIKIRDYLNSYLERTCE